MRHTTKNSLVTAVVLVVLGGTFTALRLTEREPETASSAADDITISLLSKQIKDMQSV